MNQGKEGSKKGHGRVYMEQTEKGESSLEEDRERKMVEDVNRKRRRRKSSHRKARLSIIVKREFPIRSQGHQHRKNY